MASNRSGAPELKRPAAVIFDMDGLMLDTEKIYHVAWQEAAQELGYTIPHELFFSLVGIRTEDCEEQIVAHMGRDFPLATFQDAWMEKWEQIAARDGLTLKPGLLALLDHIDALGIPKAVATSSTAPEAVRSLGMSALAPRFSVVVTGDQVIHGKPAPDIYLEAARRISVPPAACLALEDSSAGALAAHRAGMRVLIVPDLNPPTAEAANVATAILPSLHEAIAFVP